MTRIIVLSNVARFHGMLYTALINNDILTTNTKNSTGGKDCTVCTEYLRIARENITHLHELGMVQTMPNIVILNVKRNTSLEYY